MNPITQQAPTLRRKDDIINEILDLIRAHFDMIDSASEIEQLTRLLTDSSTCLDEDILPEHRKSLLNQTTTVLYLNVFLTKLEYAFNRYEAFKGC